MIRRLRDAFSLGPGDDAVDTAVRKGLADVLSALDNAIDDEAALARIYASAGQTKPTDSPGGPPGPTMAEQVCARIGMLESAIVTALKAEQSAPLEGTFSLHTARRYLFELRSGLERRTVTEQDAFRLLFITRHALHEADRALRYQQRMPLKEPLLARAADLVQLSSDLLSQLDGVQGEVMRLFGHSGNPAPDLVPQH